MSICSLKITDLIVDTKLQGVSANIFFFVDMVSLTFVSDVFQAVRRFWDRNDVKGAIGAMEKMADHNVSFLFLTIFHPFALRNSSAQSRFISQLQMQVIADVVSILTEKTDVVTLEISTCLFPLLASLLESDMDR